MINNLSVSSPQLTSSSYSPPFVGNNGQSAGSMRYNTLTQQVEVFDGFNWLVVSQNVNIGLSWSAEEAIRWAEQKMNEERELKELAEKSEAVKIALDNFKLAEKQLKTTAHLAKETA